MESIHHQNVYPIRFIGRLLRTFLDPMSRLWKRLEVERCRIASDQAALFLEADRRKQLIRNLMDDRKKSNHEYSSDQLIDPDVQEELDWRLRFSESSSISALKALIGQNAASIGLDQNNQLHEVSV